MREEKGLEYLCEIKLIGFADSLEVANMGQKSKVIIMACGSPFSAMGTVGGGRSIGNVTCDI